MNTPLNNTDNSNSTTLDEVLEQYHAQSLTYDDAEREKAKLEALNQISQLINEAISENEHPVINVGTVKAYTDGAKYRNKLRTQIRDNLRSKGFIV